MPNGSAVRADGEPIGPLESRYGVAAKSLSKTSQAKAEDSHRVGGSLTTHHRMFLVVSGKRPVRTTRSGMTCSCRYARTS